MTGAAATEQRVMAVCTAAGGRAGGPGMWRGAIAGLAGAMLALVVHAHDTWLLPDEVRHDGPTAVTLGLASGNLFPDAESGFLPERIAAASFRLGGVHYPLSVLRVTPEQLLLRLAPDAPGLAAVAVAVKPLDIEIDDHIVDIYFDEINASAAQRKAWSAAGPTRRWQERFVKHATTYVRFGAGDDAAAWSTPGGAAFEILPEADPTVLTAGDSLSVRALKNGQPLEGLQLAAVRDRKVTGGFVATGADGRARISLPQPGWWLIRGTELRQRDASGTRWDSDWVSLSLFVAPSR